MGNKVYLRTTNECNLNCSFCYQKEKHGKDHMTEEIFYNVISRLDKDNDLICLYGGEALLNKKVF
ncbi:MAG: radical SAM protein, partial [Waterburya sp.]